MLVRCGCARDLLQGVRLGVLRKKLLEMNSRDVSIGRESEV